jgi:hypothetical protein
MGEMPIHLSFANPAVGKAKSSRRQILIAGFNLMESSLISEADILSCDAPGEHNSSAE